MAKVIPWIRAIALILAMFLTQFPPASVSGAPAPVEVTVPVAGKIPDAVEITPLQGLPGEEKIGVSIIATKDLDKTDPFTSTPITEADNGDILDIYVLVRNVTADEVITIDSIEINKIGGEDPFPVDAFVPGEMQPNEIIIGHYQYEVTPYSPKLIYLRVYVWGHDSNNKPVEDADNRDIHVNAPGFDVIYFYPSKLEAQPEEPVDFTLRVLNTRAGVTIDTLSFIGDHADAAGKCDVIGKWTLYPGGGSLSGKLEPGQTAECVIGNIPMPNHAVDDKYSLSGVVMAKAGAPEARVNVTSNPPVVLHQASVGIKKEVARILRGGVEVSAPAQPGDQIEYTITIENTSFGDVSLDQVTVNDTLTGRVEIPGGPTLAPDEEKVLPTVSWIVRPNSQDPLTNIATVEARVTGSPQPVTAAAAASVDIADSALEIELTVAPELQDADQTVTYTLKLYNKGDQTISNLSYGALPAGLMSIGSPPALPSQLPVSPDPVTLTWDYTIKGADPDPLVSTVRVTGYVGGRQLSAQAQAIVDVTNPEIGITATVIEPTTTTVLRGGEAVYAIEVLNKGASPICDVRVAQLRIDPDSGNEVLIIPALPLSGLGAGSNSLESLGKANGSSTYLVASSEKDPLHMMFEVTATECGSGGTLSDRTSRVLEISDVQVNAAIRAKSGNEVVTTAQVGETPRFEFLVTNVGTITLDDVGASYCFPSRTGDCVLPRPLTLLNLDGEALHFGEAASALFDGLALNDDDANAGQFLVEVTLDATDNRGRPVALKTTGAIDVTSQDFTIEVNGPNQAVPGDAREYSFTLTNNTNVALSNVAVTIEDGSNTPIASAPTEIPADQVTTSGAFTYTIDVPLGTPIFQLRLRAIADRDGGGQVIATGTHDVELLPLITVTKIGPVKTSPEKDVLYSVTITNNSKDQTFTVAQLSDDVLAKYGVLVGPGNFTGWTGAPGTLGPGQSASADLTLPSVQADISPLVNTFTATGASSSGKPVPPAIGQHAMEVTCPVMFYLEPSAVPPILGQTLTWNITAYNTTDVELTIAQITESLGAGGPVPFDDITWPSEAGKIPPNGAITLPPFEKEITNNYYNRSDDPDYMSSVVTASFGEVAGVAQCSQTLSVALFSPIGLDKSASTSLALTGDQIEYTFIIRNDFSDKPYYVTLYDPLISPNPIPMYYNGAGQPATDSGWVEPGETVTGEPRPYIIPQGAPEELVNTASAEFPDPADPETTMFTTAEAMVLTTAPLTLEVTARPVPAMRGTAITLTYELTNNTDYEITGITLADELLGDLAHPGPHSDKIPLARLGPNSTVTIPDVPYTIPTNAPNPVINTAQASGTLHLPAGDRNVEAEATVAIALDEPEIAIEKWVEYTDTDERLPDDLPVHMPEGDGMLEGENGQPVRYCFEVKNNELSPESYVGGIVIDDPWFPGQLQPLFLEAVAATYGNPAEANRLYGGQSVEFCYPKEGSITLNREAFGDPQTNTVTLNGVINEGPNPVYTEGSVTVDIIGTDILITKSTSQPLAYIGQEVTYTIRIENRNPTQHIHSIVVNDPFLGDIPNDDPGWTPSTFDGTLEPGNVAEFQYTHIIRPQDPDPLVNRATVTGVLADDTEVSDTTQAALAVTPSQLLVRKYPTKTRALPGEMIHYTIAITNVGKVPVYGLSATDTQMDPLPPPSVTDLLPNKTAYITYTMAMPTEAELAADAALDPFVNTVTVTGTVRNPEGDLEVKGQATATVDIVQPKVSISKVANVPAAQPGGEVEYTITIRNTGPINGGDTLTDLEFSDPEAGVRSLSGFTYGPEPYIDRDSDGTLEENPLKGQPYDPAHGLEPGETLTGTITMTVTMTVPPDVAGTEFTNTAQIRASAGEATVQDRTAATIDVRLEGINVTKSADPSSAVVGQAVEYTISVENTGRVPFTRLEIDDDALSGPVVITTGFPISDEGGADTLDPGEVYDHTYTHTVRETDVVNGTSYTNNVTVHGFTETGAKITSFAQETIDIRVAEIGVEKFVCAENSSGQNKPDVCTPVVNVADATPDTVYYYVRVYNPGVVSLQNIQVSDPLAPTDTFDSLTALDPGGERWFKYPYPVEDDDFDPLRNTVVVTAESVTTPPQPAEAAATATLRLVTSDLQLTKTGPAQALIGETVTYTLAVTHLGSTDMEITGITITDPLDGTGALCTIASLAPGATSDPCTFQHTVSQADPAPLINQAFAQGTQEGVTVRDTATHALEIVTPGLSVTKTPSKPVAAFGEEITFTYVIKNTGSRPITEFQVTDSDPQIAFNQPWPATLAVGQTAVRTAPRTMTAWDPDPYTNTVTATGTQGGATVRGEATATVALSAKGGALSVTNAPDRRFVRAGETVIFAYTARNLSTEPLTGLSFDDGGLCPDLNTQLADTTLEPRGSVTVYCTITGVQLPGPLVSTVRVTANDGAAPVSDTATAQVEVVGGDLLVTKAADRFVAEPGETITFTVSVENVGTEPLQDLALFESMNLALTPELPGALLPGAKVTLTGTYTVPTGDSPDSVANTVSVRGVGANTGSTYQDSASAAVAVVEDIDTAIVALTKQARVATQPDALRARPGDAITYTFMARNVSDTAVQGVTLADPALTADTFAPADLGPGETVTWTSQPHAIPADTTATTYDNTATVTADGGTEPLASARATVPVQLVELTKTADVTGDVEPGEEVAYTFEVESFTTAELTGITLEDPLLTFDDPLLTTIPSAGATASGRLTIPDPYSGAEFVNTATLRMNGEWLDDASATVTVVSPDLEITIIGVSQVEQGENEPYQTGEQIAIAFQVENISNATIPIVAVTGELKFSDSWTEPITCVSRGALAPNVPWNGACYYTPPTGLDSTDLNPTLTLTVNGGLPGDDPIRPDSDERTLPLVDLVLGATLEVVPPSAERGENVTLELTLTNNGASPLGCNPAVRDARPCWAVTFASLPAGSPDLNTLFADDLSLLQATELQPGASVTLTSDPYTIPDNAMLTPFGVTVIGGSYDSRIEDTHLAAYKTQDSANTTLAIEYEGVVMAVTEVRQDLGGVVVPGTQDSPLQTGKPVTVLFSVLNDSDTTLNDLEYGIVFGGSQFACAPAQSGATDPLPIGQDRPLSCQFTPPVADPSYRGANGLVQPIFVTLTATDGAGQPISDTSAQGEGDEQPVAPVANITEVHLIDLKLTMTLHITKNGLPVIETLPALAGETVEIRIVFTNGGASPLGCAIGHPACALTLQGTNLPLPEMTLNAYNAMLQNVVIEPGLTYTGLPALSWTIPPTWTDTQISFAASVGTWSPDIALGFPFYSTQATVMADLFLGVPNLSVLISAQPLPPVFGQNITYTVMVRNDGAVPVTLQSGTYQIIPLTTAHAIDGIMLMSNGARPQGQAFSGTLAFTPTALMPGETATATVSKLEDQRGAYRFLVTVTGLGLAQPVQVTSELMLTPLGVGTPTPTVDPATLDPNATEPQITKEPTAPNVQPGGAVSWTVRVRNGSTGVMPGVVVTDMVPPTMTVTAAASDRGPATVNGQQVSLPVGTLNPGETVTLTINTALSPAITSPATITNTACAARQGGPQVCDVGTVTVGPGVSGLPATGIRSSGGALGWRWDALIGVAFSGALMLFLSLHASQRRTLVAVVFLLVALVAIGGAVALVLTRDTAEDQPDDRAQAPAAPTQGESAMPGDTIPADVPGATADDVMPTPYQPPEPSGARTLLIPKLSDEFPAPIPILEVPIINRQWDVSGLGYYVGWLDGTTWLESDWGNTVLAAHVQLGAQTPGPFWGLSELVPGDEIIVREGDAERVYVVMSTRKVDPDDWAVTAPTDGPTLTLITCTDWNNAYGVFAQRLVVQAIPVA